MATGDEQGAQGCGQGGAGVPDDGRLTSQHLVQHADSHVGDEVVDAVERLAGGQGESLGSGHADHERPGQSGARGHGDRVDLLQGDAGGDQGLLQGGDELLQVGTGGDLRDHPAEAHVLLHGGGHSVGQQLGSADDPESGLIARGLDAQHERCGGRGSGGAGYGHAPILGTGVEQLVHRVEQTEPVQGRELDHGSLSAGPVTSHEAC